MNAAPLGAVYVAEAFPSQQVTASTNGDVFYSYQTKNDPGTNKYSGFMRSGAIYVSQSAGTGNNGGNYLQITLQGRHDSTDPWATIPQVSEIKITTNAATGYYSALLGPLLPEMRIVVTETGTADATFRIHVVLLA